MDKDAVIEDNTKNFIRIIMASYCKKEDNFVDATKIFEVIPFLKWCYHQFFAGKLTKEQLYDSFQIGEEVLDNQKRITWRSGVPHIIDNKFGTW